MCGICGNIMFDRAADLPGGIVRRIVDSMRHRGPDDWGIVEGAGFGLGHARLSILDLRRRARQPLTNEDGNLLLTFNGAIYNYAELKKDLEARGHRFRSKTDSEVILHLYEEYGTDCVSRLRGMFAFAIFDKRDHSLFAARDRAGKKPLVYAMLQDRLVFASELQALVRDPSLSREPDLESIDLYLTYGYIPAPRTAFKGIRKLLPAHWMRLRSGKLEIRPYWKLDLDSRESCVKQRPDDVADELRRTLEEAVHIRRISDVPIGVFLSGGLDSGAVAALLTRQVAGPIKTFSIGFEERAFDESPYARFLSQHLGSEHIEFVVQPEATRMLPELVRHYGEPFADSSAIPSFYLAKLASRHVKVVLNGDGGDECFAGYDRYRAARALAKVCFAPGFLRSVVRRIGEGLNTFPAHGDPGITWRWQRFLTQIDKSPETAYYHWMAWCNDGLKDRLYTGDFRKAIHDRWAGSLMADAFRSSAGGDLVSRLLDVDRQLYLPNDLLVKMDIACMAHGLEGRSLFLDHKVMEFAATIPSRLKLKGGRSKHILKEAMKPFLPDRIVERPKKGFGVPIHAWLRNELKSMAYDLLTGPGSAVREWFHVEEIRKLLDAHVEGKEFRHNEIWTLLMLELWHRTFISDRLS